MLRHSFALSLRCRPLFACGIHKAPRLSRSYASDRKLSAIEELERDLDRLQVSEDEKESTELSAEDKALLKALTGEGEATEKEKEQDLEEIMYSGPVYECIRMVVKPGREQEFNAIVPELSTKKEGFGKLVCAFSVQVGNVGELIHLWEWEDIKERQLGIEKLQKDKNYISLRKEGLPCLAEEKTALWEPQQDLITKFSDENKKEQTEQGIYEFETVTEDEEEEQDTTRSLRKAAGGFLVGSWAPMVDDPSGSVTYNLWRYNNLFEYDKFLHALSKDPPQEMLHPVNEILYPALYSPLQ